MYIIYIYISEYITTHYGNTVDEYNEILQYFIPIDITGHSNYIIILTSVLNQFFTVYCNYIMSFYPHISFGIL
jgi:hypothetical protein